MEGIGETAATLRHVVDEEGEGGRGQDGESEKGFEGGIETSQLRVWHGSPALVVGQLMLGGVPRQVFPGVHHPEGRQRQVEESFDDRPFILLTIDEWREGSNLDEDRRRGEARARW